MNPCRFLEGLVGEEYCLRIEGRGTWQEARRFERLVMEARERGATACRIDLDSCSYLDSTFLGVLTRVARLWRKTGRSFAVISVAGPLKETMATMGMSSLLAADSAPPPDATADLKENVSDAAPVRKEESAFILEAHEELEALDARNVEKFKTLKDVLRKSHE